MGITKVKGHWRFVKRVPKRFTHVDPRRRVMRSLWTDSEREARAKAPAVEFIAFWEALAAGKSGDAAAAYGAAKQLAQSRGFAYRPAVALATASIDEIVARLEVLAGKVGLPGDSIEIGAILGGSDAPPVMLTEAFDGFCRFAAPDRLVGKSEAQKKRWHQQRDRAVRAFVEVSGDIDMRAISRRDAQKFRDHWQSKIEIEGMDRDSGNKQIGQLKDILRLGRNIMRLTCKIRSKICASRLSQQKPKVCRFQRSSFAKIF